MCINISQISKTVDRTEQDGRNVSTFLFNHTKNFKIYQAQKFKNIEIKFFTYTNVKPLFIYSMFFYSGLESCQYLTQRNKTESVS